MQFLWSHHFRLTASTKNKADRFVWLLYSNHKRHDVSVSVLCSVCQVPVAEGKSVQQTVDLLHKKLEQLGATKQGSFCVDCETYHATGNVSGKCFYLFTLQFDAYRKIALFLKCMASIQLIVEFSL